jgi:hypothetical protein
MPRACERAGIAYGMGLDEGAVFHTIRHSTTTELLVKPMQPIPTLMKITRHSSLNSPGKASACGGRSRAGNSQP